jgi:glycosyltransferase involved in cell wall biosynthesis
MQKAAFIVESGFLENHFGVRNYFSTIKSAMNDMGIVTEYLVHGNSVNGTLWYKIDIEEIEEKDEDAFVEGLPQTITLHKLDNFIKCNFVAEKKMHKYLRCVGENLVKESYDFAIITNPWTIDTQLNINAKVVVGIVYDFIANMYALTKTEMGYDWGHCHHRGYSYYNQHCDKIMAISREIAVQYKSFYADVTCEKIDYFKPFVPYNMKESSFLTSDRKENAMILAAPFDLRKGLKDIPEIVNGVSDVLDTLYIFGMPRCTENDFNGFFHTLKIRRVVYYPYISYSGLIDLYKKCKYLLFPSLEEGLGFPIIEAQCCGCRAIVRNASPMNELVLEGSLLINEDIGSLKSIIEQVQSGLKDRTFDYASLSKHATCVFSYRDIENFFITRCNE